MPQVTSLEPQKKNKGRFNVFVDDKFVFGTSALQILKHKIEPGKSLTKEIIEQIAKNEELTKLFDTTLKFLSYRPRSQKEIEDHVVAKIAKRANLKYAQARESNLIAQIISKLKKYNYINDVEFANWWVTSRNKSRPKGKRVIKAELYKKGIDANTIESILENLGNQPQLAQKALEKKLKNWKNLKEADFKKKAYMYLSSRGFDFDTIKEVVANFVKKS